MQTKMLRGLEDFEFWNMEVRVRMRWYLAPSSVLCCLDKPSSSDPQTESKHLRIALGPGVSFILTKLVVGTLSLSC